MKIAVLILLTIWFAACSNNGGLPSGILTPNKMRDVFWDVIRAETYTTQFIKKDSLKNAALENAKLQQQVFAAHHITEKDFYDSYRYYNTHTQLMGVLLDSITLRGEREKYSTLYAKRPAEEPFSLIPLPPPPPIVPIPGVKFSTAPVSDSVQTKTHIFRPVPIK
jgi:hypothetical protein